MNCTFLMRLCFCSAGGRLGNHSRLKCGTWCNQKAETPSRTTFNHNNNKDANFNTFIFRVLRFLKTHKDDKDRQASAVGVGRRDA